MASILITGANRGIGLGMVKKILVEEEPFQTVIATYRSDEQSSELIGLQNKHPNLYVLRLGIKVPKELSVVDVSEFDTFKSFAKEVEKIVQGKGLNILFNNAGITLKHKAGDFKTLTPREYIEVFSVNAFAPLFLAQALLPIIVHGAKKNKGAARSAIVNVSSNLGSVSDNATGSYWAFRESKASLNQLTRNLAKEKEIVGCGIVVFAVYPGHVKTDMGGPFGKLSVEESTNCLFGILTSLDHSMNDKFFQWDGQEIPW